MFMCAFYLCFKCKGPYFGGMKACDPEEPKDFDPNDLVCSSCAAISLGAGVAKCDKHGNDFIDFKCRYCCSVALWFCWGTTHFCDPCHNPPTKKIKPCKGKGNCDLGVALENHAPNGDEYALGCSICRANAQAK
jgi:hypothetical protein